MSRGIIYLITNKENGHKYIGQTTQGMNKRWQQHIQEALKMSSKPIHQAMRKYGNHRFTIQEIDECDECLLNEREEYWIKYYNTFESEKGYNATSGGERPIFSQETKQKLSEIASQRILTETHIENISTALTTKAKQKPWGILTDENRGNGKHSGLRIRGKHLKTGEIKEWENARVAAQEVAGSPNKNGNILLSARKGYKCYGYKWEILEDKKKKKAVFGVNKKTEQIEIRFESIADASRSLGGPTKGTGLIKSLKHPGRYSWKGFYWYYSQ